MDQYIIIDIIEYVKMRRRLEIVNVIKILDKTIKEEMISKIRSMIEEEENDPKFVKRYGKRINELTVEEHREFLKTHSRFFRRIGSENKDELDRDEEKLYHQWFWLLMFDPDSPKWDSEDFIIPEGYHIDLRKY